MINNMTKILEDKTKLTGLFGMSKSEEMELLIRVTKASNRDQLALVREYDRKFGNKKK